jgi:hypothetical protein
MAGASQISEIEDMLRNAGFDKIKIAPKDSVRALSADGFRGNESKTI